jgi:hypothetical protein
MKTIIGGSNPPGTGCAAEHPCSYYESGTGMVEGLCETNSRDQCVCKSTNSSVVWAACEG